MECEDPDFIRARDGMLDFANQFHRVDECGILSEGLETPKDAQIIEQTNDKGAAL
jgi:hypothetical protein